MAAALGHQVPDEVKADRLERLQGLLARQQAEFNGRMVGRVVPVLFERPGRHQGQLVGRSPWLQAVHAEGPASLIGRVAETAIDGVGPHSLSGRLVGEGIPRTAAAVHEARIGH